MSIPSLWYQTVRHAVVLCDVRHTVLCATVLVNTVYCIFIVIFSIRNKYPRQICCVIGSSCVLGIELFDKHNLMHVNIDK
jgi:hypothetical protein